DFYGPGTFYNFVIEDWPDDRMTPDRLREEVSDDAATLTIYSAPPDAGQQFLERAGTRPGESEAEASTRFLRYGCADMDGAELVHSVSGSDFEVRTSGNFTAETPKPSIKIKIEKDARP